MPLIFKIGQLTAQATPLSEAKRLSRAAGLFCEARLGVEATAAMGDEEKAQYVIDALARVLQREARQYRLARAESEARAAAESADDV